MAEAIHIELMGRHMRAMFYESINQQQRDKSALLKMVHKNTLGVIDTKNKNIIQLPMELWDTILDMSHGVDMCQTHLVFKRERIFNKDTYYTFSGTFRDFATAMQPLIMEHSDGCEGDELPWEHHCRGACEHPKQQSCPMDRGAVCSSIWKIMEFRSQKELNIYTSLIPSKYSYYGRFEIIDMQSAYDGYTPTCMSIGDTCESISGKALSRGRKRTCVRCETDFYEAERHYFDQDNQEYYCSHNCYTE